MRFLIALGIGVALIAAASVGIALIAVADPGGWAPWRVLGVCLGGGIPVAICGSCTLGGGSMSVPERPAYWDEPIEGEVCGNVAQHFQACHLPRDHDGPHQRWPEQMPVPKKIDLTKKEKA